MNRDTSFGQFPLIVIIVIAILVGTYYYFLPKTTHDIEVTDIEQKLPLQNYCEQELVHTILFWKSDTLITTGQDGDVILWDASTCQEIHRLPHEEMVLNIALNPHTQTGTIATLVPEKSTIHTWDIVTGKPIDTIVEDIPIFTIAYDPVQSDELILGTTHEGAENLVQAMETLYDPIFQLSSNQGTFLFLNLEEKSIDPWPYSYGGYPLKITSYPANRQFATILFESNILIVEFSHNGDMIRDGLSLDKRLAFLDLAYSPDGTRMATTYVHNSVVTYGVEGHEDDGVIIWDIRNHENKQEIVFGLRMACHVTWSSDGQYLVAGSCNKDGNIALYDVQADRVYYFTVDTRINDLEFCPDDSCLVLANENRLNKISFDEIMSRISGID